MKKFLYTLAIATCVLSASCNHTNDTDDDSLGIDSTNIECMCPHTKILIQPFKGTPSQTVTQLKKDLEKHLSEFSDVEITSIEILPEQQFTADLMNDAHTRYRADKILRKDRKRYPAHTITIFVTNKDISIPYRGKPDHGIRGLSFKAGEAVVVSTYRCGAKNPLWRVATHEFIHEYWRHGHCVKDDPKCIMQDAKGKGNLSAATGLCTACRHHIGIP